MVRLLNLTIFASLLAGATIINAQRQLGDSLVFKTLQNRVTAVESGKASLSGPAFTGNPTLANTAGSPQSIAMKGATTIDALMYLKGDGTVEDPAQVRAFTAACTTASAGGNHVTLHAAGTFRVQMDSTLGSNYGERYAMQFANCNNAVFDFGQATWLFDGGDNHNLYANVVSIRDSSSLRGNLGWVDWVKPPYAQGVVASKTSTTVDITLDPGFAPSFTEAQRIEAYGRDRTNLSSILSKSFNNGADTTGWTVTYPNSGTLRIDCGSDSNCATYVSQMTVGGLYVVTYRVYGADAYRLQRTSDVDVTAHVTTTAGMAFRDNDGQDTNVTLGVRASGTRMVSTTADGARFNANRGTLNVHGDIWNTGDDPFNVYADSYQINSITTPRTVALILHYPYTPPRVGDMLVGIQNDGTATNLGNIVNYVANTATVTLNTDLPSGFAANWRISNASAQPRVFADMVVGYARGSIRSSTPGSYLKVKGYNLTGSVEAEYIPYFYSEGIPPHGVVIDADLVGVGRYGTVPGAIVVQAYKADGSGYDNAATIKNPIIRGSVRDTKGSAVFLAGTDSAVVDVTVSNAVQNPDTVNFGLNNKDIALINASNTLIKSAVNQGSTQGHIALSGSSTIIAPTSSLLNFTVDQ